MTVGWDWRKGWELLKCKHQCHCACSSEIGTCKINDVGRQTVHTKTTKIHVCFVKSRQATCYTHVLKVYINFQYKNKTLKKITKINDIIPLTFKFNIFSNINQNFKIPSFILSISIYLPFFHLIVHNCKLVVCHQYYSN